MRARRAMSDDSVPRAVVSLVARNRRRYGGYLVHVGVSVLFAGVAASSAFQDARDVELAVGKTARVGGYDVTYVKPTAKLVAASNGRLERIDLGAEMRVRRDGEPVGTLRTERSYFPSADPSLGPLSRFFEGEATSEVGLQRRAAARRLERDRAERARPAQADRGGRPGVHRRRRGAAGRSSARSRWRRRSTASRAPTPPTRRRRRSG